VCKTTPHPQTWRGVVGDNRIKYSCCSAMAARGRRGFMFTSIIGMLLVGLIAGWLAGKIVHGSGFGVVGDIAVGIIGALIAGFLFPAIFPSLGGGTVSAIISATIGAILLLVVIGLIKRA